MSAAASPACLGASRFQARIDALPASASVRIVGVSVDSAPIAAITIEPSGPARSTSVILAGLHALEWIGIEVAVGLVERLAASPPADRRIVVVPIVNVDGVRAVDADLAAGQRRYRRWNARGVDLDRNWPTHFAQRPGVRTGPAPRSEPEVAAVAAALDAAHAAAPIDLALSLHSFGRMILIPWGGRVSRPPDHARLRAAARAVRERLPDYRIRQVSHWLPGARAHGLEIDDLHARYGALALLVECTLGGVLGRRPRLGDVLAPFRWYNPPEPTAALALLNALEPFVRGALT